MISGGHMTISINNPSNLASNSSSRNTSDILSERLSSGSRINSARDDAAGLAISERLSTKLNGIDAAIRNSGDAISSIQVADGALNSISKNIGRIQELAIQSANGALNDQDRQALQKEASQLIEESNNILENTNFNGKALLSSDDAFKIQLDSADSSISISGKDLLTEFDSLGFSEIDISKQDSAVAAISVLSDASELTISRATELGASSKRIENSIENLATSRINSAEAKSRISDTDFAKTISDLATRQIQDQVQIAMQAQANSNKSSVLRLLS